MNNKRSNLLKKLSKTLAVSVPALALSGFVPVVSSVVISSAHAESSAEAEHKGHAEAEHKSHAEAKYKKAKAEGEAEAEAEAEAKYEKAKAEGEAK